MRFKLMNRKPNHKNMFYAINVRFRKNTKYQNIKIIKESIFRDGYSFHRWLCVVYMLLIIVNSIKKIIINHISMLR